MIIKLADNILSPLGESSEANWDAVLSGRSELRRHDGKWGLPEPFFASLFPDGFIDDAFSRISPDGDSYTPFEKALIISISAALPHAGIDAASRRTLFVISTTKANVELLDPDRLPRLPRERILPGAAAETVSRFFGNPNSPVAVSNACISGVSAQMAAMRLLESGRFDHAVVAGCDMLSKFIVSGFQSFKALSADACRPFDASRTGLNLGEAAATVIYSRTDRDTAGAWTVRNVAVRNDANHISGPSRTGEGSYRALMAATDGFPKERIAFVNLHGTATAYNDEMESIAMNRAGLADVPANGMKGYYGHTLGAAGIAETILSTYAADNDTVPATKGYRDHGVSMPLNLSSERRTAGGKRAFVKLISGFGGCNAALLMEKGGDRL